MSETGKASELITGRNYEWQNNSFEELGESEYESGAPMNVFFLRGRPAALLYGGGASPGEHREAKASQCKCSFRSL